MSSLSQNKSRIFCVKNILYHVSRIFCVTFFQFEPKGIEIMELKWAELYRKVLKYISLFKLNLKY